MLVCRYKKTNNMHKQIKELIKDAMRAKDQIKLDVLRGLNALFMNEIISSKSNDEFLSDEKVLALIKKSIKQRKDSIEQFEKGGRQDLVQKEKAELAILETFMPAQMSYEEVLRIVKEKVSSMKSSGPIDPKSSGKIVGMMMKELSSKADGGDVKKAVEEVLAMN